MHNTGISIALNDAINEYRKVGNMKTSQLALALAPRLARERATTVREIHQKIYPEIEAAYIEEIETYGNESRAYDALVDNFGYAFANTVNADAYAFINARNTQRREEAKAAHPSNGKPLVKHYDTYTLYFSKTRNI